LSYLRQTGTVRGMTTRRRTSADVQITGPWTGAQLPAGAVLITHWTERVLENGTRVVLRFAEIDGQYQLVNIEIGVDPTNPEAPDPAPIRTSTLRSIPLRNLLQRADEKRVALLEGMLAGRLGEQGIQQSKRQLPAARASKRGRGGRPAMYDDQHFAEVAQIYLAALTTGFEPTKTVAQRMQVSRSTAAKWVTRARRMRLLPETTRGRARGLPAGDSHSIEHAQEKGQP
jgi:hypothetical protein